MKASIAKLLISHQLAARFKERTIGSELYEVRLPFVTEKSNPTIIKPIHFCHPQSKQLLNHGLQWKATMQQLFRMKVATPEKRCLLIKLLRAMRAFCTRHLRKPELK